MKKWKFTGKKEKGFEPYSKSNYLTLINVNSKMQCPHNEKYSIYIYNNVLIFQFLLLNHKSFSIEIKATDNSDIKRNFIFLTSLKGNIINEYNCQISINNLIINTWINLYIDIGNLLTQCFKFQSLKCIDYIHICGNCKIRKIYAIKNLMEPVNKGIIIIKNNVINLKIENINKGIEENNYCPIINLGINLVSIGENLNENISLKNNHKLINKEKYLIKGNKRSESTKDMFNFENFSPSKIQRNNFLIPNNNNYNIYNNSPYKPKRNTLAQRTKENVKFGRKLPHFDIIKSQIQYNVKVNNSIKNNNNKITGFIEIHDDLNNNSNNKLLGNTFKVSKSNNSSKKNLINNYSKDKMTKAKSTYSKNIRIKYKNDDSNLENLIKNQNDSNIIIKNKKDNDNTINKEINNKFNFYGNINVNQSLTKKKTNESIEELCDFDNGNILSDVQMKEYNSNNIIHIDKNPLNHIEVKTQNLINDIINKKDDKENVDYFDINDELNIDDLRNNFKVESNRPYSPPIGKMIPFMVDSNGEKKEINKNNLISDKDKNPLINSRFSTHSNNKIIKNYENLVYDEDEGVYFDPNTKIYYDIKNK